MKTAFILMSFLAATFARAQSTLFFQSTDSNLTGGAGSLTITPSDGYTFSVETLSDGAFRFTVASQSSDFFTLVFSPVSGESLQVGMQYGTNKYPQPAGSVGFDFSKNTWTNIRGGGLLTVKALTVTNGVVTSAAFDFFQTFEVQGNISGWNSGSIRYLNDTPVTNSIYGLTVMAIPEPHTVAFIAGFVAFVLTVILRRRQSA